MTRQTHISQLSSFLVLGLILLIGCLHTKTQTKKLNFVYRDAPSDINDFECIFASVTGSGISSSFPDISPRVDESCLNLGTTSTLIRPDELSFLGLDVTVASGFARNIRLIGVETGGTSCSVSNVSQLFTGGLPEMYVLGETTADTFESGTVTIENRYDSGSASDLVAACPQSSTSGNFSSVTALYTGSSINAPNFNNIQRRESFQDSSGQNELPPVNFRWSLGNPVRDTIMDPFLRANFPFDQIQTLKSGASEDSDFARIDFLVPFRGENAGRIHFTMGAQASVTEAATCDQSQEVGSGDWELLLFDFGTENWIVLTESLTANEKTGEHEYSDRDAVSATLSHTTEGIAEDAYVVFSLREAQGATLDQCTNLKIDKIEVSFSS